MQTWMYLVVPLVLYAFERIHPFFKGKDHRVSVLKVRANNFFSLILYAEAKSSCYSWKFQAIIYTGNVLALYMTKPSGFKYKSGMYLFVKCPDISKFEW